MTTFPTIEAETANLSTHVELCAQRYRELDSRLGNLEVKIEKIGEKLDGFRTEMKKTMVITAGTVVVSVISTLGVILSKLV